MPFIPHFFLLFLWGFTVVHFHDLPKEIPIHFNAKGVPDSYATRIHSWGIPLIATFLFFTLNFPLRRMGIETHEKKVLFWMQVILMVIFCYIQYQSFLVALKRSAGLGTWFLPLTIFLMLIPIFFGIQQGRK